ncbi:nitrogen regulation protein NR(II) [Geothrix sp. 21YS21S-2]|uniref:two-component system sensor histidine kinase NtrB n=1 Tax=Geothrix sp. 21YS21S-2 TaxID=3068893 RepID=UPI0027B987E8|nr:ATP-binding protein [Geothrix sp. 21YS21S-2]
MKLDLPTLVLILSLVGITQVIAIFIQYKVNNTYQGLGWWLLGSLAMALGFMTLSLAVVDAVAAVSVVSIPLLILGRICLFVGTSRFLGERLHRGLLFLAFFVFSGVYYYFLFFNDNISVRTISASAGIAVFSLLNARILFRSRRRRFSAASLFTGTVFLFSGLQLVFVIIFTIISGPMQSYRDYALPQIMTFIVPTITSILWTFGFILMVNQRLVSDNQDEKENLRRMFNAGPDAALLIRMEDGVLVDANEGYLRMTGQTRGEILGRSFQEVCRWLCPSEHRAFMVTMKEHEICENLEFVFQGKDGTEFIGMISARTLLMQGVPHIISVTRDFTERRKVERDKAELEAKYQKLQKAESLGRMAGAIAHHFNNQMHSVMANLEILGHPARGTDPDRVLARARQATERASEMSRLMLVYLGQTSLEKDPLDLSEQGRKALAAYAEQVPGTVAVTEAFPCPGPRVLANGDQIRQVLFNLMNNAIEALGQAPGTVQVRIRTLPAPEIPVEHRLPINWQPQAQDYAWLEVEDSGSGIPEAELEKLFDPFYTTKFTGRGLGLPVVLGLVQAHGGAVTLTSQEGGGSVFRVHLPLMSPDHEAGAGPGPA